MKSIAHKKFNPDLPDAVFDLDGTVFKFTVLEQYTKWLCQQQVFEPLPPEVEEARLTWKSGENNESNYRGHTDRLVQFFIGQIAGKQTATLQQAAEIVAGQNSYRQWDITRNIIGELQATHNVMAISLMPDWLMPAFTRDLGFVARLGCTYVEHEGSFTGEAHSIDKATVYQEFRGKDVDNLDIAMGDTTGDLSIFGLAKRPIAFNPSHTLATEVSRNTTLVIAEKDLVTVINPAPDEAMKSNLLHCSKASEVLDLVKSRAS